MGFYRDLKIKVWLSNAQSDNEEILHYIFVLWRLRRISLDSSSVGRLPTDFSSLSWTTNCQSVSGYFKPPTIVLGGGWYDVVDGSDRPDALMVVERGIPLFGVLFLRRYRHRIEKGGGRGERYICLVSWLLLSGRKPGPLVVDLVRIFSSLPPWRDPSWRLVTAALCKIQVARMFDAPWPFPTSSLHVLQFSVSFPRDFRALRCTNSNCWGRE